MKVKQKLTLQYIRARLKILSLVSPRKAAIKAFELFCTPQQKAPQRASGVFDKGEPLSFRLQGHTVRGHRWLPRSAEALPHPGVMSPRETIPLKKVLIVHGFESTVRNFDGYVGAFLKKGYEVLAFDAPAHGASGGRRISLPLYVEMLTTISQNYGPIHSFMGHSLGGLALALYLEKISPEGTEKVPPGGTEEAVRLVLIAPAVETTRAVDAFFLLMQLPPEVRTELDEYILELSGHPFSWFSLRRALFQVRADILYLQDEEDRVIPMEDALVVKKDNHPNIHFVFTRGLGHRKIYKDPEMQQQIVAFL